MIWSGALYEVINRSGGIKSKRVSSKEHAKSPYQIKKTSRLECNSVERVIARVVAGFLISKTIEASCQ